jgi:hypothetical protein
MPVVIFTFADGRGAITGLVGSQLVVLGLLVAEGGLFILVWASTTVSIQLELTKCQVLEKCRIQHRSACPRSSHISLRQMTGTEPEGRRLGVQDVESERET